MTEKIVKMVQCDLHKTTRPATHLAVPLDLCDADFEKISDIIQFHLEGHEVEKFPCEYEDCPRHERPFGTQGGLTKHLTQKHGHEPTTRAAQEKRANGNGAQSSPVPLTTAG